jgi:hypothetical protein
MTYETWVKSLAPLLWVAAVACDSSRSNDYTATASSAGAEQPSNGAPFQAFAPSRQRFVHVPRAYPAIKLKATRIDPIFVDRRVSVEPVHLRKTPALALPDDGETLEVSLPLGFEAAIRERLDKLATGSGPVLGIVIEVQRLNVSRHGEVRRSEVEFGITVVAGDRPLLAGSGNAYKELTGAYHDSFELEELHRAPCLDAFDHVLASETNLALINRTLGPSQAPLRRNAT